MTPTTDYALYDDEPPVEPDISFWTCVALWLLFLPVLAVLGVWNAVDRATEAVHGILGRRRR